MSRKGGQGRCGDGECREVREEEKWKKGQCGGGGYEGRRKKEDMGVESARREEEYEQYLLIGYKTKSVNDCGYISSFHKQFLCVRDQHFSYTKIMHHTDN